MYYLVSTWWTFEIDNSLLTIKMIHNLVSIGVYLVTTLYLCRCLNGIPTISKRGYLPQDGPFDFLLYFSYNQRGNYMCLCYYSP